MLPNKAMLTAPQSFRGVILMLKTPKLKLRGVLILIVTIVNKKRIMITILVRYQRKY